MDDKNLMIRVLEWATKQGQFTFQDLCQAINPTEEEREQLKLLIHYKSILYHNHPTFYSSADKTNLKIFASAEDHFRLLEYQELKEARESSKEANSKSLIAIGIAVISTVISIFMSIAAMSSDINVPDRLYQTLKNSNQSVLNELESIREVQVELNNKLEVKNACLINSDPTYK